MGKIPYLIYIHGLTTMCTNFNMDLTNFTIRKIYTITIRDAKFITFKGKCLTISTTKFIDVVIFSSHNYKLTSFVSYSRKIFDKAIVGFTMFIVYSLSAFITIGSPLKLFVLSCLEYTFLEPSSFSTNTL